MMHAHAPIKTRRSVITYGRVEIIWDRCACGQHRVATEQNGKYESSGWRSSDDVVARIRALLDVTN